MRKVLINRENWCRGKIPEYGVSQLLNDRNNMCCLGFSCNQLHRIKKKEMLNMPFPDNISSLLPKNSVLLDGVIDSDFSCQAAEINDRSGLPEKLRETQLTKLFAENDIELTFKGE